MSGYLTRALMAISLAIIVITIAACRSRSATNTAASPTASGATATVSPVTPAATDVPPTPASIATALSTPIPTDAVSSPTATVVVSPAVTPNPTETAVVTPKPAPEATPLGTSTGGSPPYIDDRSSGVEVIQSYYNAINRKEYDRAYSYWEPGVAQSALPSYSQFKQGYADTQTIRLTIGQVRADAGAGQRYNAIPVALAATLNDGTTQSFVGCYTLHLAAPPIQDQPPFRSWQIQSAQIQKVAAGVNPVDQLSSVCLVNGQPQGMPVPAQPTVSSTDISKSRYLDDRSTPEEVLRSYYNAINSREYDRAYSYWEPGAATSQLPTYSQFKQGYANTASVELSIGKTTVGAAAGNLFFHVPTALVAHTTTGQTQTFVGCYTLHLGQPAVQDQPPYQPLAIQAASLKQVANNVDLSTLLTRACPSP